MPSLHHLALRTRDVEGLRAFYQRWFGLALVRDARPRSVWLGLDGGVLMIELAGEAEPHPPQGSLELLAFRVSDPQRLELRARLGAMLEAETQYTLYFRDPDGRRVGASSYPLDAPTR